MAQVQCPNCGGFKVSGEKIHIDPKTKRKISTSGCGSWVIASLLWLCLMIAGGAIFGNTSTSDDNRLAGVLYLGCVGLSFVIPIVGLVLMERNRSDTLAKAITTYKYSCLLCGYAWEWHEGEPWPEAHIRPDLIAKGEERLQAEAAERRRQEEAAWLLQQQRKK